MERDSLARAIPLPACVLPPLCYPTLDTQEQVKGVESAMATANPHPATGSLSYEAFPFQMSNLH